MTHPRWFLVFLVTLAVAVVGVTTTTRAMPTGVTGSAPDALAPHATQTVPASGCAAGAAKSVDPGHLILGQSAGVTLVVTHTCPQVPLPVDMVIIADMSQSMTRGQGGGIDPLPTKPPEPVTPDPSAGPPTKPPDETPGAGMECKPPPFCGGGSDIRTAEPTATSTRWWQRTPTPLVRTPEPTPIQEYAGGEDYVRDVRQWVGDFLGDPVIEGDFANGRLHVGFVGFNRRAVVRENLTDDAGDIQRAANRLRGADITNIRDALREADRILNGAGARNQDGEAGRQKVVVILSDFEFCPQDVQRMGSDTTVIAVGIGVDRCDITNLQRMASGREWVFERARAKEVVDAYEARIVRGGRPVSIAEMVVRDELSPDMALQWDSWNPPTATVNGSVIEWPLLMPLSPVTTSFQVRPLIPGLMIPVSVHAEAVFTDTLGLPGRVVFPEVSIDVEAHTATFTPTSTPTSTPTLTPTPTPTHTPTPAARYLPIVRKRWPPPEPTVKPCVPEEQTVDVALVIDTSTSMSDPTQAGGQPKIDAAIEAARVLVSLLKPDDQTAVVGFNSEATVVQVLTGDTTALDAALDQLPSTQAMGTSIYRGLAAARDELVGPRHRSENNRSIVLVTDGQHNDPLYGLDAVRALATEINEAGIDIVTVGLGSDIDEELLRDVATTPEYFFRAPDASDLLDIYREIAHLIPCP